MLFQNQYENTLSRPEPDEGAQGHAGDRQEAEALPRGWR